MREEIERRCHICKHYGVSVSDPPCVNCFGTYALPAWEPAHESGNTFINCHEATLQEKIRSEVLGLIKIDQ